MSAPAAERVSVIGMPGGLALRHFGLDPVAWRERMELRAQVVSGLDEAPDKPKSRRKRADRRAADVRKDVR